MSDQHAVKMFKIVLFDKPYMITTDEHSNIIGQVVARLERESALLDGFQNASASAEQQVALVFSLALQLEKLQEQFDSHVTHINKLLDQLKELS